MTSETMAKEFVTWRQETDDFSWTEPFRTSIYRKSEDGAGFDQLLTYNDPYDALVPLCRYAKKLPVVLEMWGKITPIAHRPVDADQADDIDEDDLVEGETRRIMLAIGFDGSAFFTVVASEGEDDLEFDNEMGEGFFAEALAEALLAANDPEEE